MAGEREIEKLHRSAPAGVKVGGGAGKWVAPSASLLMGRAGFNLNSIVSHCLLGRGDSQCKICVAFYCVNGCGTGALCLHVLSWCH